MKIDGYARLITDKDGNLLSVEDVYCNEESMIDFINDAGEHDSFGGLYEDKDAKILVLFKIVTESVGTWEYTEYDTYPTPVSETVLIKGHQEYMKQEILKMAKYGNYTAKTDSKVISQDGDFAEMIDNYYEWYGEDVVLPEAWEEEVKILDCPF